jgi:hypothetical protein
MPLDPYIARGVAPIDPSNTLMQIAALKQRDRSLASDEQQNALMRERFTAEQGRVNQQQEGMKALAKIEWAMRSQSPKAALLSDPQAMQAFSAQGVDLNALDDNGARELLGRAQAAISSQMGIRPEAPGQVGALYKLQDGTYQPADKAAGQRFYQDPQGGGAQTPAAVMEHQWFLRQPPEVQAQILNYRRGNSTPDITRENAEARALGAKEGERLASVEKKIADSANMSDALDIAVTLVPIATGSGTGALFDRAAGAFGYTPSGAEATASLQVVAAKVLENVPRMEGPQSDRDAQMYREAAGQLGDPSVTRGAKMAAIRTIRQLTTKYAVRNGGGAPAAPSQPGALTPEEQAELQALRARFKGK